VTGSIKGAALTLPNGGRLLPNQEPAILQAGEGKGRERRGGPGGIEKDTGNLVLSCEQG
jgi:hypothetical protein